MIKPLLGGTLLLLFLAPALNVSGQSAPKNQRQLRRELDKLTSDEDLSNAIVGVSVIDLKSGEVLFGKNADKTMMPASNAKLYTTAAALDQLGPAFTWSTSVFADPSRIEEGILDGNLIVRGSGDPVIGGRFNDGDITQVFREWADSLRAAGITTIAGDLVGDDDYFDELQLGVGWSWDDEPFWYSAEIGALSLNDNSVDFSIVPTLPGGSAQVHWEPLQTSYVQIRNSTVSVDSTESLDEGYARLRDGNVMTLTSKVPVGYTERESIAIHNPTTFFLHVMRETLVSNGIAVLGDIVDIDDLSIKPDYSGTRRLASHTSPDLASVVEIINKLSHNLYAEQVLKTLGRELPDPDSNADPGSAAMGWAAGIRTLATAGVDTSRIQLVDGSGLSRMNFLSPSMSTALLKYMWAHPDSTVRRVFQESLPIAGMDGTLENRMKGSPAVGNARAKTGTFTGASALSGYVTSAGGTDLAFSLMMNMYTGSSRAARRVQDAIVETLSRYRR
jgi:serine-type D-Ala-D-Ala carboxypeptidase/endopeptidase (penicillin-binding protein 4)